MPRFTVLTPANREQVAAFFRDWAALLLPVLVPGANVVVAANPLLSYLVAGALAEAGLERRGEIVRLVTTMRGGDRPKGAHEEFAEVSAMPRSMWEPWLVFRKPLEGRVQDNLRKWRCGGFRRPAEDRPFGDVIRSVPTRKEERALAPHPSLKPQAFLRQLVRGVLPLGEGTVLDPFCGAGSTLAAAEAVGYASMGVEKRRAVLCDGPGRGAEACSVSVELRRDPATTVSLHCRAKGVATRTKMPDRPSVPAASVDLLDAKLQSVYPRVPRRKSLVWTCAR